MFCHLYWFAAAATQGKFFLFWNSNIYVIKIGIRIRNPNPENPNPQCKKYAIESESADFLAGLPSLVYSLIILY